MAKVITQQTFDDVVRENMEEFGMDADEAIDDAVKQFESQSVNLSNIVKDSRLFSGQGDATEHPVITAIKNLKISLDSEGSSNAEITDCIVMIRAECDVDLSRRCLAGNNQAYPALIQAVEKFLTDDKMLQKTLLSLLSLTDGQPDLLDDHGCTLLMDMLDTFRNNEDLLYLTVGVITNTCTKHEGNRQMFVKKGLISKLSEVLNWHKSSEKVVIETCGALRVLTLDDDIRVPFGQAHENAKSIVTEGNALETLLNLCKDYTANPSVLKELFSTLTKLLVRSEFCKAVSDMEGLEFILRALQNSVKDKGVVRQALGLIKALAGNDEVKVEAVKSNAMEIILVAMIKHQANSAVAELCCASIASLILRNPNHCTTVMNLCGHQSIIQAMKIHPKVAGLQKQACNVLRNLVARTREHCEPILELGAEALINEALKNHPICEDDAKAALRDLGCHVELKERWKGVKGSLVYD
ncbi:armadillo repeat-containing protein 6-like [Mizuhopecten yessoensis]|uniref:Armadillo repeat-containing protein 6 n=1 Tax=Mizuhopecten yessoensis TaxID=6573 RepID=A0A210QYY1_MIZYE|nr:armadillo repeat-containing protein 6-like [Mizuhopecten yessoensis]OWF53978.1 Armadillo repeat-containing protein 6 [Mizuhopecten yessoensis]